MVQVGIRIPKSLVDRVDTYAEQIRAQVPGLEVNRSDALRALVLLGLESVDRKKGRG